MHFACPVAANAKIVLIRSTEQYRNVAVLFVVAFFRMGAPSRRWKALVGSLPSRAFRSHVDKSTKQRPYSAPPRSPNRPVAHLSTKS